MIQVNGVDGIIKPIRSRVIPVSQVAHGFLADLKDSPMFEQLGHFSKLESKQNRLEWSEVARDAKDIPTSITVRNESGIARSLAICEENSSFWLVCPPSIPMLTYAIRSRGSRHRQT